MPNGRCRLHGGRSLRGIASPTFKTGRYSKEAALVAAALARAPAPRRVRVIYVPVEVPPTAPPLSMVQQAALVLLNAGQTISETARLLRLPRQTVQRWVYRSAQMQARLTRPDLLERSLQAPGASAPAGASSDVHRQRERADALVTGSV